ncbi:DeoR/GlpR family DNA-binding transcription regulator [Macrococcus sp. EM39E]|uniref:DeoR/GlpR family DNA-binding transcription regulator n=1 Tax=Macrococcus animalis TaxID=3395467 RepID=UPI0039BF6E57
MIPYIRREKILEILNSNDLIKIELLQEELSTVSMSTLRRDLKELEREGKVQLLSGGAVKKKGTISELSFSTKSMLNTKEKEYISSLAIKEIEDGDTIYLDSGSTCTVLLTELVKHDVHIVTSNTNVFNINRDIIATITVLGGTYNPNISSLSGSLTLNSLDNFIFDKAFLGANGIDKQFGITTPTLREATKKREVKKRSKETYVLCDSTKFDTTSSVKAFEIDEVTVITDKKNDKYSSITNLIN